MICRIGIRKLQRAGEIGHGGHWQPLLEISGRLHLESHPFPRLNAKDTCSERLEALMKPARHGRGERGDGVDDVYVPGGG